MSLKEDLINKVGSYFREPYVVEETKIIPSTDYSKLTFGNKGLVSEFTFLFVDIRKSSELHDTYGFTNAAKIYQSFHDICLRIIEHNSGKVRAFDGDRIMGVFSGDQKRTNAIKSAMNIRWAINNLINPNLKTPLRIGCGIDIGKTLITKVGKGRDFNNNDLIWIGKGCNYASHLTQEANNSIVISQNVYDNMLATTKYKNSQNETENMWSLKKMKLKNNTEINTYVSTYTWAI